MTNYNDKIKRLKSACRAWAEINLDKIAENYGAIKGKLPAGVKLCCTVKADAYGHGALEVSHLLSDLGADMLSVATLDEAIELRRAGITLPILILGYTPPDMASALSLYDISQCVYSEEYAHSLFYSAKASGGSIKIHIKLDTGMGRLGFSTASGKDMLEKIHSSIYSPFLICEGIFTHPAAADGGALGEGFTRSQFNTFLRSIELLESRGMSFKYRHFANSATVIEYPEYSLDMVRVGIALYGIQPSRDVWGKLSLREALSLKSRIAQIKELSAGQSIGYGRACILTKKTKVATLSIGYADGISRSLSMGALNVTVNGKEAPTLGRICMDQLMIDITDIDGVSIFSEVTLFGYNALMSAYDIAEASNTIPYETLTSISKRVPRIYIRNGTENNKNDEQQA